MSINISGPKPSTNVQPDAGVGKLGPSGATPSSAFSAAFPPTAKKPDPAGHFAGVFGTASSASTSGVDGTVNTYASHFGIRGRGEGVEERRAACHKALTHRTNSIRDALDEV